MHNDPKRAWKGEERKVSEREKVKNDEWLECEEVKNERLGIVSLPASIANNFR